MSGTLKVQRIRKDERMYTKKYVSERRLSPNLKARKYPNETRKGRDNKMWTSTRNKSGYFQWRHVVKSSKTRR